MLLSDFRQEIDAGYPGNPATLDVSVQRTDLDLAFTYNILGNLKVYAGCKYMMYALEIYQDIPGGPGEMWIREPVTAVIPTAGIGFSYPLQRQLSVSGQAGLRYVFFSAVIVNQDTGERIEKLDASDFEDTWGVAGEVAFNYLAYEKLFIQLGYRFEWFHDKVSSMGATYTQNDYTHGPVLAVLYLH